MKHIIVEDKHFEYLSIQRGEVSDHRHDRCAWQEAYEESLQAIYHSICSALPAPCDSVLDIGGGLGGIDVLLHRHYRGTLKVCILDGMNDAPVVVSHSQTFSNAAVAADFLERNGVREAEFYFPRPYPRRQFSLIVSFAAYCFHIPPTTYFDVLTEMSVPGTVFIFDVRITKPLWLEQLCALLGKPIVLDRGKKHVRLAWTRS
jgi:hypothetical protein